ncbi:Translation initiation factor 3 subunit J component [Arthroderma sp. PD_2]|nr:Translation initiation factor 3 subunit J component [Arthroderma sp. PD_2]
MAPSKWEDEEQSTPPSSPPLVAAARRKFDDEEDSDDVLDDWEAAEDSEVEREKAKKAAEAKAKADAEALAKKKSRAQRIAEHQAAAARRREEESSEEETDSEEDLATKREELRRTEQAADLKHAEDLFGDIDLARTRNRTAPTKSVISDANDPTKSLDLASIPLFKPSTKPQFTALTNALVPLLTAQSKKAAYTLWLQDFTKQLVKELPSQEIKKIASAMTAASNEKLKEEKAAEKGGKKTKAAKTKTSLVATRAGGNGRGADLTAYDDVADDLGDDDFM